MARGRSSEAEIIEAYKRGDRSNYTTNIIMNISEKGVEFGKRISHIEVDSNGIMDGFYNDGNGTIHIFEFKYSNRKPEMYEAQVNRYAFQMTSTVDFHTAITYVIYQNYEECIIAINSVDNVRDNYFNTKDDSRKIYAAVVDRSPEAKAKRATNERIRRAERTTTQRDTDNAKKRAVRANRTEEQIAAQKAKDTTTVARANARDRTRKSRANKSEAEKATARAKRRADIANRTPEQVAKAKAKGKANRAAMTPEQRAKKNAAESARRARIKAAK